MAENGTDGAGGAAGAVAPETLPEIVYSTYQGEHQMAEIQALIDADLSEPYSIFTYRYFINQWPHLCMLAHCEGKLVGVVVNRAKPAKRHPEVMQGYIAMLAVDRSQRERGIGTTLVHRAVEAMAETCHEVTLEAEAVNAGALRLYENLGFVRYKRLMRYYLNGGDAFRLKLWLRDPPKAGDGDKASESKGAETTS